MKTKDFAILMIVVISIFAPTQILVLSEQHTIITAIFVALIVLVALVALILFLVWSIITPTEQNLEKIRVQFIRSSNARRKASISKRVVKKYANFDIKKLNNLYTIKFLEDCRNDVYLIKGEKNEF